MSNFQKAFEKVLGYEGGYVNNPNDPGGETKYGISKRAYPDENIKLLTIERAKELYKRDYWDKLKLDEVHTEILPMKIFSLAVLFGVGQTKRFIKRAENLFPENIYSSYLSQYEVSYMQVFTALEICAHIADIEQTPTKKCFWKGWLRRAVL